MKLSLVAVLDSVVAAAGPPKNGGNNHHHQPPNACHPNKCNNAVTGSGGRPAAAVRKADCASYLPTVVAPSPVILTTYIGDNSFYYNTAITTAVTSTATHTPAYATACAAAAADYAAACRCWGVTGRVTTVPQPTVTVTKTKGCQA